MGKRIEDYAMIGDGQTAALVGRDGSIDWLCFWRFDSAACFASLLGTPENGRWLLAPKGEVKATRRRYREGTLVLETEIETDEGVVVLVDAMPIRDGQRPHLVRVVEGKRGRVSMQMELVLRFDYGSIVPWVRSVDGALRAIGGQEAVRLVTPVPVNGKDMTSVAEFTVGEGERVPFVLSWHFSYEEPPPPIDGLEAIAKTTAWWEAWSKRSTAGGPWRDAVQRSFITLKALTNAHTGGIVAAATTSLPEQLGGVRNWDYRYCWVRDATFTLLALLQGGYKEEAAAWREWLLRAIAGKPSELQIMYGVGGERRLTELELPWLAGYEKSKPVRVGNAAWSQRQIDVYGELLDCMFHCQKNGLPAEDDAWNVQRMLLDFLEGAWEKPDEGIWEVRGGSQHFTHSKMMAWVAMDRAIATVEGFGAEGPIDKWRALRQKIFDEVCRDGFDAKRGAFTQVYGGKALDASLLMMPLVGFLPATDARVAGTIEAIQRELVVDGFVRRYIEAEVDGVAGRDGAFIPCTFWLADCLALIGKRDEARATFERLLALRNDVGLLSEEYDPRKKRMLGNFPQAFSHVALINTALSLEHEAETPERASKTPSERASKA
jgi:GH15 family glucan-1,4-alpha-glucosidase